MVVYDFSGRAPRNYPDDTQGVMRYIAPRRSDGSRRSKCITEAELAMHRAARRPVGFVFEDSALNSSGGARQGDRDGKIAVAEAQLLGVPAGVAIYAAVDRDVKTAELPTVAAYLDAFHKRTTAAGYRRGGYGELDVVDTMLRDGHIDLGWQTVAWSGKDAAGRPRRSSDPRVVLYQRAQQVTLDGTVCDVNSVLASDWGQWNFAAAESQPTVTSLQEDLLMAAANNDNDARRALVRWWCLVFWGAEPTVEEQNILTYSFGMPVEQGGGADLTLGRIADHDKAKAYRASQAA